jgi:hypothetical protein
MIRQVHYTHFLRMSCASTDWTVGGDSITGMAVVSRARKEGLTVRLQDILKAKSITELSQLAMFKALKSEQAEDSSDSFSLSPIQKLYFQSAAGYAGNHRFNQSITVHLQSKVELDKIRGAIRAIISRHGMLRARFAKCAKGAWQQMITKVGDSQYSVLVHSALMTISIR